MYKFAGVLFLLYFQNEKKGYTTLEIDVIDFDDRNPQFTQPDYQLNVIEGVNIKFIV